VSAWIGAAYWFTASFANPAVTIARSLSNTFAGIRPADVPGFMAAQLVGALPAMQVAEALFPKPDARSMELGPRLVAPEKRVGVVSSRAGRRP
jgi:glycerol uptake facilitator-like aquaporin